MRMMNLYLHARLLCDIISNNILWLIVFISARKKCVEIALSLCKSLQVRSKIIHQILITQTFGCNALWNWWNVELMMRCRQSREVTPTKSVPMFALLFAVIEIYPELSIFFFWTIFTNEYCGRMSNFRTSNTFEWFDWFWSFSYHIWD